MVSLGAGQMQQSWRMKVSLWLSPFAGALPVVKQVFGLFNILCIISGNSAATSSKVDSRIGKSQD
jgi:hypothetical protein